MTVSRPERGLAVDQDHVVVLDRRGQHALQGLLAGHLVDQLHLGGGQVDVGGQQVHAGDAAGHDDLVEGHVALHQQVVDGQVHLVRVQAEADRQRALRVEVDQQHLAAELGERGTQVDGRRGLADATLLVAHRDDARALPWVNTGFGSGRSGIGRPVGPSTTSVSTVRDDLGLHRGLLDALLDGSVDGLLDGGLLGDGLGRELQRLAVLGGRLGGCCGGRAIGGISDAEPPKKRPNPLAPLMVQFLSPFAGPDPSPDQPR